MGIERFSELVSKESRKRKEIRNDRHIQQWQEQIEALKAIRSRILTDPE